MWTTTALAYADRALEIKPTALINGPTCSPGSTRTRAACLGGMGIGHVTVQMERDQTCE